MCSHDDALAQALNEFKSNDPRQMAENSGAECDSQNDRLQLAYCGYPYGITFPQGEIETSSAPPVCGEERVLFLQYLNWSRGLPPRRKWLSFLELPGGELHNAPFQKEAIFPIAAKFGRNVEKFVSIGEEIGEPMSAGDAAFIIPVFPFLEMAIIIWGEDEEYSARANILFDEVSIYHLPTASLYVLGILVAKRLFGI